MGKRSKRKGLEKDDPTEDEQLQSNLNDYYFHSSAHEPVSLSNDERNVYR